MIRKLCEFKYIRFVFTYCNIRLSEIRDHLLLLCKQLNHAKDFSDKDSECKLAFTTVINVQLTLLDQGTCKIYKHNQINLAQRVSLRRTVNVNWHLQP